MAAPGLAAPSCLWLFLPGCSQPLLAAPGYLHIPLPAAFALMPPTTASAAENTTKRLLAASGCFWLLLADLGCSWLFLAAPGCSWLLLPLAGPGFSRLLLAASGFSWLFLAVLGCFWLLPAAPGSFWLLLAARGCPRLFLGRWHSLRQAVSVGFAPCLQMDQARRSCFCNRSSRVLSIVLAATRTHQTTQSRWPRNNRVGQ